MKSVNPTPTPGPSILVAWEITVEGLACIAFAATRSRAQWMAVHSYRDAFGDRRGSWPRVTARRRRNLDHSPAAQHPAAKFRPFGLDYVAP